MIHQTQNGTEIVQKRKQCKNCFTTDNHFHVNQIFIFKYSPRPGTPAAGFPDQIPEDIKTGRIKAALALQEKIGIEQHSRLVDLECEILVENHGRGDAGFMQGRTRGNHVVHFRGNHDLLGRLVTVKIERACKHSLRGQLVG